MAGLGVSLPEDALRAAYYATLDLAAWGKHSSGKTSSTI